MKQNFKFSHRKFLSQKNYCFNCVLLSIHMSFCPFIRLSVLLSICVSFCPSICLCVCVLIFFTVLWLGNPKGEQKEAKGWPLVSINNCMSVSRLDFCLLLQHYPKREPNMFLVVSFLIVCCQLIFQFLSTVLLIKAPIENKQNTSKQVKFWVFPAEDYT